MLAFLCYIVMSCIFPFHVSPRLTASTLMASLSCVTVTSISTSLDLASLPLRPDLWFHVTFPQAYDPQHIQSVFTIWFSEPTSPSLTTSSVGSITIIWHHHQCWTRELFSNSASPIILHCQFLRKSCWSDPIITLRSVLSFLFLYY